MLLVLHWKGGFYYEGQGKAGQTETATIYHTWQMANHVLSGQPLEAFIILPFL